MSGGDEKTGLSGRFAEAIAAIADDSLLTRQGETFRKEHSGLLVRYIPPSALASWAMSAG
jgi:hypothetical protein